MKNNILILQTLLLAFLLTACGTQKKVAYSGMDTKALTALQVVEKSQSQVVNEDYMTAKMNFRLQVSGQDLSVGGNLKMKKDDVIQLSLVALGLMEAARIEFTPQDVLIIDRLNKRYVKASYDQVDFLKESGIDFQVLQSLFRNSIFLPANSSEPQLEYTTSGNVTVSSSNRHLKFRFLTSLATSLVQQTQITSVSGRNDAQFDWTYSNFNLFNGKSFPMNHQIKLKGLGKEATVDIQLSRLGNDSKWETRTTVKSSYKAMQVRDILRLLQF